jgi:copper chaperone
LAQRRFLKPQEIENMPMQRFLVANVKCQGCASTIRNGLQSLSGVSEVEVDVPSGEVVVRGEELSRDRLAAKLAELGYPPRQADQNSA